MKQKVKSLIFSKKENEENDYLVRYNGYKKEQDSLCIFASFSYGNIIAEYVFHYLEELVKSGCDLVFVSTSPLSEADIIRLKKYSKLILETPNVGLDFGSWKCGLSKVEYGIKYRKVILANDSVFGPFHDLKSIVREMTAKGLDMWGMTESQQFSRHIQSYFMCFNHSILQSSLWVDFWKNMERLTDKNKIIQNYELGISKLMMEHDFKIGAYVDYENLQKASPDRPLYEINPAIDLWKPIIQDFRYPFLKRELLIKGFLSRFYQLNDWEKVVSKKSKYNTALISDYLADFEKNFKSSNERYKTPIPKDHPKIAVHLHLFYTDLAEEFISYLKRINSAFDLYVTFVKDDQFAMYKIHKRIPHAHFLMCENRGKDIGGLITFLNHVDLLSYDLILKIHSKKSLNSHFYINEIKRFDKSIENGDDWRKLLLDSLIPRNGVEKIIEKFAEDDKIGMMGPQKFLAFSSDGNEPMLGKLCNDLGLDPYFDKTLIYFAGSMFWIRPDILHKIKQKAYSSTDFAEGNILNGGLEHAFERIFGSIAESLGYRVNVI
jgi:lipopolysaccharide biosynthesis protein